MYYPASEAPHKWVNAVDGHHVTSFGEHAVIIHVQDSKGEQRTYDVTVEAVNMHGFDLILGVDWLSMPIRISIGLPPS